jgi:peptidoglycan/xylan/chitin deacetylase (PgdA/CDA1 family)
MLMVLGTLLLIAAPLVASEVDPPVATILGYHEVGERTASRPDGRIPRRGASADDEREIRRYTATRENFHAQLDYLQQNGYSVVPLSDLVDLLKGRRDSLAPRAVVITVDDGWLSTYTEMLPEFRARKLPFTLFVYPKFVGYGKDALTWKQLRKMAEDGVDIQSHTFTHAFLTLKNNHDVSPDQYAKFLEHELGDSKQQIESRIKKPVRFLSYPYGDHDAEVVAQAARYGYEAAVTTNRGRITRSTPPLQLKRYIIHNDTTLEEFKDFLLLH